MVSVVNITKRFDKYISKGTRKSLIVKMMHYGIYGKTDNAATQTKDWCLS